MSNQPLHPPEPAWWLARIPDVFAEMAGEIAPGGTTREGMGGYFRIAADGMDFPLDDDAAMFCRWRLPVHHAWPCNPEKTGGFVEKAASTLAKKFTPLAPVAVLAGAFDPQAQHGYFRKLASNLRGRLLQLMPASALGVDALAPDSPVLYVMLGSGGMFCGWQSPRQASGFFPGGTRFIRQSGEGVPSRAGAKIAEALHHMRLLREPMGENTHWLELGASPGGMTAELLQRGHRVTAIDRAPLDDSLRRAPGLRFFRADVARWRPADGTRFTAMLCDMNGPAEASFAHIARLAPALNPGSPVIFTLKTADARTYPEICDLHRRILASAAAAGLAHLQTHHLTYNRRELTLFLAKP